MLHALLQWLVGRELADDVVGDLTEQRGRRLATGGPITAARTRAWARYWRAALGIVGYLLIQRGRVLMRYRISFGGHHGELRQALRSLGRAPWYSATVIAVAALSLAIATTAYAIVEGVLFRPLPFPSASELHVIGGVHDDATAPPERVVNLISGHELAAWSAAAPETPMTGVGFGSIEFEDGSFATVVYVDARYFDVLGAGPLAGGFRDEHFASDRTERAVILGPDLWRRRFGGAPDVIGRRIVPYSANSRAIEIAGVLPPGLVTPPLPGRGDVDAVVAVPANPDSAERSRVAIARVPRDRVAQLEARLNAAAARLRADAPPLPATLPEAIRRLRRPYDRAHLVSIDEFLTARQRPIFTLLFGTALSLALLVVLNAGALAAGRARERDGDVALRRALGARTRDLVRQALVEQGVLVSAGAVVGLAATPVLLAAVLDRLPDDLALLATPAVDWRAAGFALALAAAATLSMTTMAVVRRLRAPAVAPALAAQSARGPRRRSAGRLLVMAQTALAFAILLGGSLLAASLARVWSEDPGFRTQETALLTVRMGDYVPRARGIELASEVRALPGVTHAAALDAVLLRGFNPGSDFRPPAAAGADVRAFMLRVSGGFFDVAGLRLLEGRLPTDAELDTGARVVAVSDAVARAYWPVGTAVGRTLRGGRDEFAVVGVVADARLEALDLPPPPAIYAPLATIDSGFSAVQLFVWFDRDAGRALTGVVDHVTRAHPDVRLTSAERLGDVLARTIRPRRFTALVGASFGSVALAFVGVGVLGLVAMSTAGRTREIGVRLALGSTRDGVVRLLLGEQFRAVGAGLAAGAVLSWWLVGLLEGYVYELSVYDPLMWTLAALTVLLTTSLGTLLPALRASRIDPGAALRE